MVREYRDETVLEASLDRFRYCFQNGHVCISFSGGKDSTLCVELAIIAAQSLGITAPVDVVYRDEECVSPETTAFALRMAARPEVRFHWCIAHQPIINIFDRNCPYIWTYDPLLNQSEWMQPMPDIAVEIPDMNIESADQTGDVRYFEKIQWCIELRLRLLGFFRNTQYGKTLDGGQAHGDEEKGIVIYLPDNGRDK